MSAEITDCPASSSSLDLFYLGHPLLDMQSHTAEAYSNCGVVTRFTDLLHLCFDVPSDKIQRPVCNDYDPVNVGIPGKTNGDHFVILLS